MKEKTARRVIERAGMKGILKYKVFRGGVPIEEVEERNLIVNGARAQMARLIAGEAEDRHITHISFGTSGDVPVLTDDEISEPFTKEISGYSFPESGQVQFDWELLTSEANGMAIHEFGLLTADGVLFSRRVRDSGRPVNKESDISIEGQWIIVF
jgi:hypothetical protein